MSEFFFARGYTRFDLNAATSDVYTRDGVDDLSGESEFSGDSIDQEELAYYKGGAGVAPGALMVGYFATQYVPASAMILNVSELSGGVVTATAYAIDYTGDIGYGTFSVSRGGFDNSVLSCSELTDVVIVASPTAFIEAQLPGGQLSIGNGKFTVSGSTPPLAPRFWTQFKSSSELV